MAREKKGGSSGGERSAGGVAAPPTLARVYEGPGLLDKLLEKAGAQVDTVGLVERFQQAIAEDRLPPEVIPGLFPQEPRFSGPDDAMRLYSNLFGVWDLLTSGVAPAEVLRGPVATGEPDGEAEENRSEPTVELPPRGSVEGSEVPYEVVEGTWQLLGDLPPRERTRSQDRYTNGQPELAEWARTVEGLDGAAQETLEYLCFELAEMFDHAFGDRFGAVRLKELLGAEPDVADKLQPYAADYVAETLEEAEEDDEDPIGPDEITLLERYARQALVAMTRAVRS